MLNIQTLNKISKNGLKHLPADEFAVADSFDAPDGIIVRSADMHALELPSSLKAIARAGAGVNNIPIDKCSERGIVVFNTPGANANAVKELVIAGLLLSSRRVVAGVEWVQAKKGEEDVPAVVEKGKADFTGPEISGKTLGIIGLGAIGKLVAQAATALGMKVVGYDPFARFAASYEITGNIDKIYAESDYVTLHLPYGKDTKNMINAAAIAKMKDGARLLNFARGELVEDSAVLDAVNSGKLSVYVTDFPNGALLGNPKIITIPHLGASSPESEENCAEMAAIEIRDFLKIGTIKNSVNFPDVELAYSKGKRVLVLHKNIPNTLALITHALGYRKINIGDMTNASKGENAYTIIDVDSDELDEIPEELLKIAAVRSVRII